MTRFSFRQTDQ